MRVERAFPPGDPSVTDILGHIVKVLDLMEHPPQLVFGHPIVPIVSSLIVRTAKQFEASTILLRFCWPDVAKPVRRAFR